MKLPFDLLSQNYVKPRLFLCETDKTRICELETISMSGSFKFNTYSELTFTIGRTYTNMVTGETQVNPFYEKVEGLRLVYLEGFGYFEIQDPEIVSDGIKELKNITAYSLEYRLSQKYLENFYINTGEADSVEVIVAGGSRIVPVTLYNQANDKLSLLDLSLEKIYDWKIGHVDESLKTMSRQFEISRASVYDFIMQDICEKFNCFAVFDTINNKINLYAEALITKHIGDGTNDTFLVSPPYSSVGSVSIDSYKTTKYTYDPSTGRLIFDTPPENGARIEITDGSQEQWTTDVYVTFNNLAQEVNVSYSAEDIKTVLTVKGEDDLDIREVNMGLPYIVDLSYYYTVDWMGQDLYDAYTKYLQTAAASQSQYATNAKEMLEIADKIVYENQRLSLQYSIAENVTGTTVGTYYVRGGTSPNYYYREVKLPDEYNANIEHYYMLSGTDLNEDKFSKLYAALQTYFVSENDKDVTELKELEDSFAFMETNTINSLANSLSNATNLNQKETSILNFFDEMWNQIGHTPLSTLYYQPYKKIEATNKEAGWNETSNENYWRYYPVTLVLKSLEDEIEDRQTVIDAYKNQYLALQEENNTIAANTSIYNNFTHDQLVRLSPFLREDEYTDDNFVETDSDTNEILMKTKQELLECGRIELKKLCEPKLAFSMDMANIYALPEFEPIIDQFQLGNLINVAIRDDYIKRARLLAVDINFDDFSDFTCEFGELTNLKTPSSIHADLLASALSAGKSVASNQSYWEKGAELATSTDIKIQQGLLNAVDGIYSADKSVLIDNHGILLRKVNENGEFSPYQIWLTNNNILVSTDAFDTAETGIGVFEVDGKELYGVLAKAVLSGYIESSTIVGGTIYIGERGDGSYNFEVDQFGNVTMRAGKIDGYVEEEKVIAAINLSDENAVISGEKISLAGKEINLTSDDITIDSTNFSVTKDGKITATSGEIAGWSINPNFLIKKLTIDGTDYQMYLQAPDGESSTRVFVVGTKASSDTTWDTQFSVNYAGKLIAKNADITGHITANSLTLGSGVTIPASKVSGMDVYITKDGTVGSTPSSGSTGFKVSSSGLLTASNAVIYGTIYASEGKIAGWNITNSYIDSTISDSNQRLYLASASDTSEYWMRTFDSDGNATFSLTKEGKLIAKGADVAGKVTASSGSIGSWSIGDMGNYTDSIYTTYCAASTPSSGNPEYAVFMRGKGEDTTIAIGVKKRTSSSTSWNDAENPFYVRKDGYVKMTNANVTGTIHASSGTIGGFYINEDRLICREDNSDTSASLAYMAFNAYSYDTTNHNAIIIGTRSSSSDDYTTQFRVRYDGSVYMRNATITGDSTIAAACIPNLSAAKITSGTLDPVRIPNLSANKITSGTLDPLVLDASVITTGNFSSKTLSTGNLSVTNGGNIGIWTVNSNNYLYAISGDYGVSLSATSVSHGQGGSATWVSIVTAGQNASDERLKTNITGFDDKFDRIYDGLKPVQFEYAQDFLGKGTHFGYIAQDVIKSFENEGENIDDYSFIYETELEDNAEEKYYQLNKSDFIALNTWQIQKLKNRITELENRLESLERNDTK